MRSTYVLRRSTAAPWTTADVQVATRPRNRASLAASSITLLRQTSSLTGRETILVLVLEIVLGELVHHLGICSRLIISAHLVEPVEVPIATAHAIPPIAVAAAIVHHVHGGHVVHRHAHVSTKIVVHAVHAIHTEICVRVSQ